MTITDVSRTTTDGTKKWDSVPQPFGYL